MLRLINAKIFILFKSRAFKVLCVIALVLALFVVGGTKLISSEEFFKSSFKGMSAEQQLQLKIQLQRTDDENQPFVQSSNMGLNISLKDMFHPTAKEVFHGSFGSGVIEVLMSVLIGLMVASEYSKGTIKNVLAYGKKREQYYIAKLISITVGLIIILGIIVGVSTIISSFMFGWGEAFNFSQITYVLTVFGAAVIVGMAISSLIMLLATLLKSNGATIGSGIAIFTLVPSICSFLYGKFDWFDNLYKVTTAYNWTVVSSIKATNGDIFKSVIVSLIILIISTSIGIMIFKKQDIK